MSAKDIFYDADLVGDIKDFILFGGDNIAFVGDTKTTILNANDNDLIMIGKSIGSKITIHSADIVTPDFIMSFVKGR